VYELKRSTGLSRLDTNKGLLVQIKVRGDKIIAVGAWTYTNIRRYGPGRKTSPMLEIEF
jgi:hypothetical protein